MPVTSRVQIETTSIPLTQRELVLIAEALRSYEDTIQTNFADVISPSNIRSRDEKVADLDQLYNYIRPHIRTGGSM